MEKQTSIISKLEAIARGMDFNPECSGELVGIDAVMEFLLSDEVREVFSTVSAITESERLARHQIAELLVRRRGSA